MHSKLKVLQNIDTIEFRERKTNNSNKGKDGGAVTIFIHGIIAFSPDGIH